MAITLQCLVGKEVVCNRDGRMGVVIREDGFNIYIRFGGTAETAEVKRVTSNQFNTGYKVVEDGEPLPRSKQQRRSPMPEGGAPGAGKALYSMFMNYLKRIANQDLEIYTDSDREHRTVVKYNGHNVFQLRPADTRLAVYCNPDSLCAQNKARVVYEYPKKFKRSLRSKFVFTTDGDLPLMQSIIVDGLFFRQIVIEEDDLNDPDDPDD